MNFYLFLKALHIVFAVTWFAGLFYLPRIFIYLTEAQNLPERDRLAVQKQLRLMQRKLWYIITWPSSILTITSGAILVFANWLPLSFHPWLMVKLALVMLLFLYHLYLGRINRQLQQGNFLWTSLWLRMLNEFSSIFLIGIVFLAVFKNNFSFTYGLSALIIFTVTLMAIIKFCQTSSKTVP